MKMEFKKKRGRTDREMIKMTKKKRREKKKEKNNKKKTMCWQKRIDKECDLDKA